MAEGVPGGRFSPSAWTIVGLGLYWVWTFFSFNQASASCVPLFVLHTTSMAGASACLLLIAALWKRLSPLCGRRPVLVACGAAASAFSLLYLLPGLPAAAVLVGACASGCAIAPVVCALGERFCRIPAARTVGSTVLFLLFSYAVMLALSLMDGQGVPPVATGVLVGLMPALTAALLCLPGGERGNPTDMPAPDGGRASAREALVRLPWRTFSAVGCVYFAVGGIRAYTEHIAGGLGMETGFLSVCIVVLLLAFVAAYSFGQGRVPSLAPIYKASLPLVIVGYVVLVSVGPRVPGVLSLVAHLTCLLCEGLCWLLAVESVRSRGVPPLLMMAICRLLVNVGMSLGELACIVCFDAIIAFAVVAVLLLVLSFVFLFSDREASVGFACGAGEDPSIPAVPEAAVSTGGALSDPAAASPEPSPPGLPEGVDAWGLTERERTVLVLWVTSHGARAIGEALGLSESTVKTHIRHIYEKAGVRNRAELIDRIDAMR